MNLLVVFSGEFLVFIRVMFRVLCLCRMCRLFMRLGFCLDCEKVKMVCLVICSGEWFRVIIDMGSEVIGKLVCCMVR